MPVVGLLHLRLAVKLGHRSRMGGRFNRDQLEQFEAAALPDDSP
jgi:hypothetical protein